MALIITDKTKIIAIADAVRAQTGSTEPLTLDQLIAAVGEIPSAPDIPGGPEEPVVVSLASGLYNIEFDATTGTYITPYDKYVAGDIDGANSMLIRSWEDITSNGDITVNNHIIEDASYDFDVSGKFLVIDDNITSLGKAGVDVDDHPLWGPLSKLGPYYSDETGAYRDGLKGIYIPNSITEIQFIQLPDYVSEVIVAEGPNSVDFYGGAFSIENDYVHFTLPKNVKLHGAMWTIAGNGIEDIFIETTSGLLPYITITFNGTMEEFNNALHDYLFGLTDTDESTYTLDVICTDGIVTENCYYPY